MTLTITIPSRRVIYQCADYRLLDLSTRKTFDFGAQKAVVINAFSWTAIVAFAGIGRTSTVDVSEWLAKNVASIGGNDPFERVVEALLEADSWLSPVEDAYRRHSFSVGAFLESTPLFALVSNHESTTGPRANVAASRLSVSSVRPTRVTTFVSGQTQAVLRSERRRLARLVERDPDASVVYDALVALNVAVSDANALVSPSCFTSHIRLTGEGGAQVHGLQGIPLMPSFPFPEDVGDAITRLMDEQFGKGRGRVVSISTGRSGATDEFHATQLREKPKDANVHNNFGAYLKEKKADIVGAEREYREALHIDPKHVNALGNLANLLWDKGDADGAKELYQQALGIEPPDENASWNFTRFLISRGDHAQARAIVERALIAHPASGRLRQVSGDTLLAQGRGEEALQEYDRAGQLGASSGVQSGRAIALQLSGAPIGDTIAAYWTAIGFDPDDPALHLNLAQLLFLKGEDREARVQLALAVRGGLENSAKLEAEFYQAAYTGPDLKAAFLRVRGLLEAGARLRWDVSRNIEMVERDDPERGAMLRRLKDVMTGELPVDRLPAE